MGATPDVKLLVGIDQAASGSLIDGDIAKLQERIDKKSFKAKIEIKPASITKLQSDISAAVKTAVDAAGNKNITLKVTKIDTTSAMSQFKADLQRVVNSVSLQSGQSLLIDAPQMGTFVAEAKKAATATSAISSEMTKLQARLSTLKKEASTMDTSFAKVTTSAATADIDTLRNKLVEAKAAFTNYENAVSNGTATDAQYQEVVKLNNEYSAMARNILDVAAAEKKKESAAAKSTAETALLEKGTKAYNDAISQTSNLLARVESAKNNWTSAKGGKSSSEYAALEGYVSDLNKLITAIETGKLKVEEFRKRLSSLSAGFNTSAQTIKSFNENTQSAFGKLGSKLGALSTYMSASYILMRTIQSIKNMISASIELDDAMTQLQIVTRATNEEYEKFGNNIVSTAEKIGASVSDLIDSTTVYARLGYSLSESEGLAQYTSMLSNVGDIDVSVAQDAITAITKAYGIGADEIESYMDKMVVAGNNFPISVSQIAEGMNNAASALSSAGNSFEESVGLLTAANTVVQDISKASTGLRTITARLRSTTVELDELGEAMTEAEYEELVQALTDCNVSLKDQNGEFRSTYDIMSDIAAQWDKLTSMEQAAIANAAAGNRQQTVFFSIIEQFQTSAADAVAAMSDSEGSLQTAYDEYMESTTAHLGVLKATMQELSSEMFTREFLNFFVDAGTASLKFVDTIARVITALGGLNTVLIAVSGTAIINNLSKIGDLLKKANAAISSVFTGTTGLTFVAIAAGIISVTYAIKALKAAFPTLEELNSQAEDIQGTLDVLGSKLETNKERIAELKALKASGTISIVEQQELADLERENSLLQAQINLQNELLAIKNRQIADKAASDAGDFFDNDGKYASQTGSVNKQGVGGLNNAINFYIRAKTEYEAAILNGDTILAERASNNQSAATEQLLAFVDELNAIRDGLDVSTNAGAAYAKQIDDAILSIAVATGDMGYIEDAFSRLPSEVTSRLEELGDTCSLTASVIETIAGEDSTGELQGLLNILAEYGYTADDVAYQYNKLDGSVESVREAYQRWYDDMLSNGYTDHEIKRTSEYAMYMEQLAAAESEAGTETISLSSIFGELANTTNDVLSEQEALQNALKEHTTGQSLSVETYQKLLDISVDYADCLEYVNGSILLNTEKVAELTEAKIAEQEATNNANKTALQAKYMQNASKIASLRKELLELNITEDDTRDAIQANIDSLLEENGAIRAQCSQYDLLNSALEDTVSAYTNWKNAQNSADQGDMFDSAVEAVNYIDDTLNNTEFEYFYKIGLDDYTAAVDFIIPDTVDKEDTDAVNSYINGIQSLFTYDDDGNYLGLNLDGFIDKAINAGLMEFDDASGDYKIVGQTTMAAFADGLGLSLPLVQAMFGELEEYKAHFDWADEASKTLGDLAISADVSAEHLREAFDNEWDVDIDISSCDTAENKVKKLDDAISNTQSLRAKLDVDSEEYQDAQNIIRYCIAQKQLLEEPAILQVDTSKVSDMTADAIGLVEDFISAQNQLELDAALGIDTSSSQAALDKAIAALQSSDNDVITKLGIDATSSQEDINAAISSITIDQVTTFLGIDDSALLDYSAEDKYATVIFNVDSTRVNSWTPPNKRAYVYYHSAGVVGVNGTAHLYGTANAGGNWGSQYGGTTLVGELGREIVVSPNTGQWYTVGDNGPEFVSIPRGSIVFNHLQTESLLQNGYAVGRATALAMGTAMVSGGISANIVKKASTGTSYSNSYSSTKNTVSASTASSSSVGSSAESEEDSWFERMYKYHQHLVSMEQETDEQYFNWLRDAYQKAYNEGIIELEDYYSYQEECFELTKSLFEDHVNDIEHYNSMLEHFSGNEQQIIANYKSIMSSLEEQIKAAYSRGLDNNSEYVQELQEQWFDARDAITEIQDELYENAKSAVEDLIDFRIDMIKQDLENQKDAINDELDALKDFYDKQRDMLEEQYDEEDYLREQAEKRKSVTDIQSELNALQFDNSAWAAKRRLELQDELSSAKSDLDDFERDRAREEAAALLDAQQEEQEAAIELRMQAIEDALNNPKAIYDQALSDIRGLDQQMYDAMLDFNSKYGSGRDEDVSKLVDAAYKATEMVCQTYKDVSVGNLAQADVESVGDKSAAGEAASQGSWETSSVNTDVIASSVKSDEKSSSSTSSSSTSSSTSSSAKSYPYGKASDTSGNIGQGSRGTSVKAIQYALNQLGFGNSGTSSVDGIFGSGTAKAVRSFQGTYGLTRDGIVGVKTRNKFSILGYESGTDYATPGIHEIDEAGSEYLFTSSDGSRYRVLNAGDKVLNASASTFLYDFATGGKQFLYNMIRGMFPSGSLSGIHGSETSLEVTMGDININGNASQQTVSEIRRAQRDNVDYMLRQLKKLNT